MLASAAAEPFDSRDHLFELKWDGIRCLAFVENGKLRLQSRNRVEITDQFPELAFLQTLPTGTVLDGEVVVMNQGRPSLSGILQRVQLGRSERKHWQRQATPAFYVAFDLLYYKTRSWVDEPLINRRTALEELLQKSERPNLALSEGVREYGRQLFTAVANLQLEGIMAKYLYGSYLPGKRSRNWLKIKPLQSNPAPPGKNLFI